jgi:hypothetical protein
MLAEPVLATNVSVKVLLGHGHTIVLDIETTNMFVNLV